MDYKIAPEKKVREVMSNHNNSAVYCLIELTFSTAVQCEFTQAASDQDRNRK